MKRFLTLTAMMLLSATMVFAQSHRINEFPYYESFENGLGDWTLVDADDDGFNWMLASEWGMIDDFVYNGEDCILSMSYDHESGELFPDNWIISPLIQLPAEDEYELSWFDAALDDDIPYDQYSVYIASNNTVDAFLATDALTTITLEVKDWTKRTINLAPYAGQEVYIAFRHYDCSDDYVILLDYISIILAGMPTLSLHGPQSAIAGNEATFTAICNDNNATIHWTLEGATPSTATGNTITAIWEERGDYTITIEASNDIGYDLVTKRVFVHDCSNLTVPFYTHFGYTTGLGCWTAIDANNDGLTWAYEDGYGATNYSWNEETGEDITPDDYLVSSAIFLPFGSTYELFYEIGPAEFIECEEHFSVYVSTTGNDVNDFTDCIFTYTIDETVWYLECTLDLTPYAGQTVYIAFHHHDSYGHTGLALYDVTVSATEGTAENNSAAVSIFPNPTNGIVNVEGEDVLSIEVIDVTGRVVLIQQGAGSLDMSLLPNGVYAIRTLTEKGVSLQKVMKH